MNKDIYLSNTLAGKKEIFKPINDKKIGMYAVSYTHLRAHETNG